MQDLLVDRQNRLWVGTRSQGLYRRDAQGWTNFRPDNSDQPLVGVGALHEDARGELWLVRNWSVDHSSATGPVVRYDGQRWTTVQVTRASGYFQPLALTTDAAGHSWVGEANGFLRYDGTWRDVAIPELRVTYQLATDRSGYVWAGTNQGLVRIQAR
jgi:ligand-binding sensor domain-containing protein